jgi:hypothetical protein
MEDMEILKSGCGLIGLDQFYSVTEKTRIKCEKSWEMYWQSNQYGLAYVYTETGRYKDAGVLYEVSYQKGNEQSKGHQNEERKASYTGNVSQMRHKDVPYRQKLNSNLLHEVESWVS